MVLFRSEEHVAPWREPRDFTRRGFGDGATVPLDTVWQLARTWYPDARDPSWRPRSRDESQALLERVGLTGDFWRLP